MKNYTFAFGRQQLSIATNTVVEIENMKFCRKNSFDEYMYYKPRFFLCRLSDRCCFILSMLFGASVILFLILVVVIKTISAIQSDRQQEQAQNNNKEAMMKFDSFASRSDIAAGCYWSDDKRCAIACIDTHVDRLNVQLTALWSERPNCATDWQKLELIISGDVLGVTYAQPSQTDSPFKSVAFAFVKSLTLRNATYTFLPPHLFDGFDVLTTLNIVNVTILAADIRILDPICRTLEALTISEESSKSTALHLAAFTGGNVPKPKLRTVRIRYNLLGRLISSATFLGAERVVILSLPACRIETIAANTFDNLSYLELLNLDGNRIKTIPSGLFDRVLPSYALYIHMRNNPWHCDCDICYLRECLRKWWWSFTVDKNLCVSSEDGQFDAEVRCRNGTCYDWESSTGMPSTEVPGTTTTPRPPPTAPTAPAAPTAPTPSSESSLQCFSSNDPQSQYIVETVKVKTRNHVIRIVDNLDGTVNVTITTQLTLNTFLLWFDESDKHYQSIAPNSGRLDCRRRMAANETFVQTIRLDLRPMTPYTFCLMTNFTVVSPFNCMTYNKRSKDDEGGSWFTNDEKRFTVIMLCVGIALMFIFGLILGWLVMKRYYGCCMPKCTGDETDDSNTERSRDSTRASRRRRRNSTVSTISAHSYAASAGVPSSRFEVVQREIALAQIRDHRRMKLENAYYLQSFMGTGTANIYESSTSTTPETPAPAQPIERQKSTEAAASQVDNQSECVDSKEPENYYSNLESVLEKK